MEIAFQEIIANFDLEGTIGEVEPFGNGLINRTFRLHNQNSNSPDYLLQGINGNVFHDIPGMMANLENVITHLANKSQAVSLTPIKTLTGNLIHRTSDDRSWRMFLFLEGYESFDTAPNTNYVYEGAKAFGSFIRDMSDFPAEQLNVVIPEFHNLGKRFEQLQLAKTNANAERLEKCAALIENAELQYARLEEMVKAIHQRIFPIRVTHNDTKFNNVLFKSNGEAGCVVDLDTTMPGIVHFDFGDGLRTGVVECDEDEKDLKKLIINEDKLQAYCNGFLEPLKDTLTKKEIEFLPLAAPYMALIMGVRFLTDYLNDDVYYHIEYPDQNYLRARCQIRLGELFYEKRGMVEGLVQ